MALQEPEQQPHAQPQQQAPPPMPGYELDINKLIDASALLAHDQQVLSFPAFKQLFQQGCYAYIHQAYWGCEHSPEYAQLLFAVALDRLDIPSPTAPRDDRLWQLHQLVPKGSCGSGSGGGQLNAAAAAGGCSKDMEVDTEPLLMPLGQQLQLPDGMPLGAAFGAPEQQQQPGAHPPGPGEPAAGAVEYMQQQQQQLGAGGVPPQSLPLPLPEQTEQDAPPDALQAGGEPPVALDASAHQQQQQQQQQAAAMEVDNPLQASPLQPPLPQQQQPPPVDPPPLGSDDWLGSPLLQPQQHGQPGAAISPSDPLWQLMSSPLMAPQQQQQHSESAGAAAQGAQDLDSFMLPGPAIPAAGQQQQQLLQGQQELQQQQLPLPNQNPQPEELPLLPDDEEDEFLADLLAILDEATLQEEQQQQQHDGGARPAEGSEQLAAGRAAQQQRSQWQQQQLVLQIPLVVKGAVVFTLLALHESQLNYPRVPIYVPLPLLQQLGQAAAEFKAAGPAAADALQALRVLTSQQRLLVGQFRRPNHWEPQLPASLMPGGRMPGGLGLNTAVGAAARKAARTAARSAMQSAAVAAAARAARSRIDPGVHREALFHIKTALRGLSNFRSLQTLCDEYASARRAIFDPLLGASAEPSAAAADQQQTDTAAQAQQRQPQAAAGAEQLAAPRALVVKRGGSRRKRQAAIAAPSTGGGGDRAGQAAAAGAGAQPASSQPPAAAAAGTAPGTSLDLPELFDTSFANSLQGLANSEASRMLLLLDPYYNASKVRKRTAEERRAAKAAQAAATAEAREKLNRFKKLTMARAVGGQHDNQQQQQAAPASHSYGQELVAAGVVSEADLQGRAGAAAGAGLAGLSGSAQQVMRRVAQQRQANMQVAEEWLRAESTLLVVDGNDEDEDMP